MASSAITGAFLGFVGLKAFVAVGPGLASITMFVDIDNSMNFVYAIIGLLIAMSLSFVFNWKAAGIWAARAYPCPTAPA